MWQYAVQQAGRDFEPISAWSSDAQLAIAQVKQRADRDLLAWNPTTDDSEIYRQYALEDLVTRIDHTIYARLLETITTVVTQSGQTVAPILQRQWYLIGYLACLDHRSLRNTAAALLSVTVLYLKTPPLQLAKTAMNQLRGLADQARCWLMAAQVSALQLVATTKPLAALLQHLLTQTPALDCCCVTNRSASFELASDAYWLSQVETAQFNLKQLQSPTAYQLIRAAYLERTLN